MLPLTRHARERMEERGITATMVAAVVHCGEVSPGGEPGTVCHSLCGLRVLSGAEVPVVITAWAERPHPADPGPKRRARLPGQMRRRIEREERRAGRCW